MPESRDELPTAGLPTTQGPSQVTTDGDVTSTSQEGDPNPPSWLLVSAGIPITIATIAIYVAAAWAEATLARAVPLTGACGPFAGVCAGGVVTAGIIVMGIGTFARNFDVAYWSHTAGVNEAEGRYQLDFELFPPWGLTH
jgi:hypothetical protein